jgi:hypothetical protein
MKPLLTTPPRSALPHHNNPYHLQMGALDRLRGRGLRYLQRLALVTSAGIAAVLLAACAAAGWALPTTCGAWLAWLAATLHADAPAYVRPHTLAEASACAVSCDGAQLLFPAKHVKLLPAPLVALCSGTQLSVAVLSSAVSQGRGASLSEAVVAGTATLVWYCLVLPTPSASIVVATGAFMLWGIPLLACVQLAVVACAAVLLWTMVGGRVVPGSVPLLLAYVVAAGLLWLLKRCVPRKPVSECNAAKPRSAPRCISVCVKEFGVCGLQ